MEYNIFYSRLLELQKKSQKSFNQIEKELGYPRNSLHNYKNGGIPSGQRLLDLSNYFHCSPEFLIGNTNIQFSKSIDNIFYQLDISQKRRMCFLCYEWLLNNYLK